MFRNPVRLAFLLALLPAALGCTLCCGPDDYNYGAYGGRWRRSDMSYGRVGSAFTDVGFDASLEEPMLGPNVLPEAEPEADPPRGDGAELATFIQ